MEFKMKKLWVQRCLSLCLTFLTAQAMANAPSLQDQLRENLKIEKFKLANGLTVIFHQDDTIPMISYHQWFRVGSRHEKKGRTGLAHFFEHLMFKGSLHFPGESYDNFINGNGGYNNAFTTRDYTGYFTLIPSDKLQTIIKIESDRLANLNFDEKQIQSEREVVKEERRYRYDNSPDGALYLLTNDTVFQKGPYSWPVIGSMVDLNAAKLDELRAFYRTYYAPNNAVVVVAGKFNRGDAKKWIEEAYGSIQSQEIPKPDETPAPEQTSPRNAERKMSVQAPKLSLAFKSVSTLNKDDYALQTLASLMGGGPSSRLYKLLVRKLQLVTSVSAGQNSDYLDGVFSFDFDLRPGVKVQQVIDATDSELRKVQRGLTTAAEMAKVKNEVLLNYTGALKSMAGKARLLAYSETIYGDPSKFIEDLDHFAEVTEADVKRVANTYLTNNRRSTVTIVPK